MTKVYKITNSNNCSAMDTYFSLQYKLDKAIYPAMGKIFAFDTLYNAEEAIRKLGWRDKLIWEAEADAFKTENVRMARSVSDIRDFWESRPAKAKDFAMGDVAPSGTVLCSSLRLLTLIGEYNENGSKK